MALDPTTKKAAEQVLASDEGFRELVIAAASEALAVQVHYMKKGSPQERLTAARGFMPVFAKLLTDEGGDNEADKVNAQTRTIIGKMMKPKPKKLEAVEDVA